MTAYPPDPQQHPSHAGSPEAKRPGVVTWFTIYLFTLAILGALAAMTGLAMVGDASGFLNALQDAGQANSPGMPTTVAEIERVGWIYGLVGITTLAAALGWFLAPRPAKWTYGVVLIAVGMTLVISLIVLVPLLIFWVRGDVKAWYAGQPVPHDAHPSDTLREPWDQ